MKKVTNINQKNIEEIFLHLERNKNYKQYNKVLLLEVALKFIFFYKRLMDVRYLNLVLKIKDIIPKNILLNKNINELINKIKKN